MLGYIDGGDNSFSETHLSRTTRFFFEGNMICEKDDLKLEIREG